MRHHCIVLLLAAFGLSSSAALPPKIQIEQIEVNVRPGGVFAKKGNETILKSTDELQAYLREEKASFDDRGLDSPLIIRVAKGNRFKTIQEVIVVGAAVGLKSIGFASYEPIEWKGGGEPIELEGEDPVELEGKPALPSIATSGTPTVLTPLTVIIDASGKISLKDGSGTVELLENDPQARELPKLSARLKVYQAAAELTAAEPVIEVKVNPDALQRRVVDVLNALAGAKITNVTFVGLMKPKDQE